MNARALVARNLRRLRVRKGLSQEVLAVDAQIDRTYVSRLERGLENRIAASGRMMAPAGRRDNYSRREPENDCSRDRDTKRRGCAHRLCACCRESWELASAFVSKISHWRAIP